MATDNIYLQKSFLAGYKDGEKKINKKTEQDGTPKVVKTHIQSSRDLQNVPS